MVYHGTVRNGVVVLEGGAALREGTAVKVLTAEEPDALPTLAERFADVIGKAAGLPTDMAENHDHYLHGQPKRTGR